MKPALLTASLLIIAAASPLDSLARQDAGSMQQKELEAARADLQRAARRVAELSQGSVVPPHAIPMHSPLQRKPRLGVLLTGDDDTGVRITGITPDSGAAKAGLRAGDRLVGIGGKPIAGTSADERLANARAALADLKIDVPVSVSYQRDGRDHETEATPIPIRPQFAFSTYRMAGADTLNGLDEDITITLDDLPVGIAPEVQRELRQLGRLGDCKEQECRLPVLAEAFRWSNLNLARVDPSLGRYFGTDIGVLVLSVGEELKGLQAGDVIRRIEGKPVTTPREVMQALRGRPEEAKVSIDYLRDRRTQTTTLTIPEATSFHFPAMSRMEAGPRVGATPGTAPKVLESRRVMIIDQDGNLRTFEDGKAAPLPPPAPPVPPAGKTGTLL
ncbi:PDZ domain-containing protein [Pseudoxanthomonas sp. PXM03]|uniref:PDZ domain-containing protein n=1 Tax=Pseudoxanthomonas sp. PXM03 TaxID=2769284 RepID=UPI001783C2E5|nr:PDZ domain-containing protein [Pseudoxanthomonas sp. PXM03]MBD9435166.1 PDZ domain-containing protein [Pseudoxanthomonas sp. PXM03]